MPALHTNTDARVRNLVIPTSKLKIVVDSVQLVTCQDVITLNAQIITDGLLHTYEWVQISGTPVTFVGDTHQQMVVFHQAAIRDDKVFRFYVDKGQTTEQSKDVLVTTVSRDPMPQLMTSIVASSFIGWNDTVIPTGQPQAGSNGNGSITLNNNNRSIVWPLNATIANIIGIRVVQIINGMDVVLADVMRPLRSFNNIVAGNLYRLDYIIQYAPKLTKIITGPLVSAGILPGYIELDTWEKFTIPADTVNIGSKFVQMKSIVSYQVADTMSQIGDVVGAPTQLAVNMKSKVTLDPVKDNYTSACASGSVIVSKQIVNKSIISIG